MDRDAVVVPEAADVGSGPTAAASSHFAGAIQDRGDGQIGQLPRQHTDEIDDIGLGCPAGLSNFVLLHRQLRVVTTLPMNDERQCAANDIDDDFLNQQPNDLLSRLDGCAGATPCLG